LALNGLHFHLKDKLEGHEFSNVTQVLQKALAQESRAKDSTEHYKSKVDHLHIHNVSRFG
jgi:diadenosine tetraphosphate (Ap4A) HIT family hydrolase